jgi:hypothetical protein
MHYKKRCAGDQNTGQQMGWFMNPQDRQSPQHDIAHRTAANVSHTAKKREADDIHLLA